MTETTIDKPEDSSATRPARCLAGVAGGGGTASHVVGSPEEAFLCEIYEAMEALDPLRIQFELSGARCPPDELLDAVATLVITAGRPDAALSVDSNYVLSLCVDVAAVVASRRALFAADWRQETERWPPKVWSDLRLLRDEAERLLDPGPTPQPRTVQLETFEELTAGKDAAPLSAEFLLKYYSLPDYESLDRCKKGLQPWPTSQELPPEDDQVIRLATRPPLGLLVDTAAMLLAERDQPTDIDKYIPVPE